jgi:hypothetical protein
MSLCRHYVRELRRSVLVGTPDNDKAVSKRSSAILDSSGDPVAGPSILSSEKQKSEDEQMSKYLRDGNNIGQSPGGSLRSQASDGARQTASNDRPRPSFISTPQDLTSDSNSPAHTVARADIRASAEKILFTYLLPGSEREIILPNSITHDVTVNIEEQGRDDPEVFDSAKDYVFQAMERDAFPGFLRMKALGNLIPPSMIIRLVIGLLAMFGGFWASFVLIFLDESRMTRIWVSDDSVVPPHKS